jgi:dynein heavy chain
MPAGLEKVAEVERLVSVEGPQTVDLYLKSAIEGVVIEWAYLVNDVVTHESSAAFDNGQNPIPYVELEYWSTRLSNLR